MTNQSLPTSPGILEAANINFAYPTRQIFTQWSHRFGPGLTWVQGRNGEGKSTLLRIVAGSLDPQTGSLSIRGTIQHNSPIEYRRLQFWCGPSQIPFDHLTPLEYFSFMAHLYPGFDKDELKRHIDAFALNQFLGSQLSILSTGTQRKVWISAALSAGTPITLLDEPFNALDAASTAHLRKALKIAGHDAHRAYIVVSHEDIGPAGENAVILNLSPNRDASSVI